MPRRRASPVVDGIVLGAATGVFGVSFGVLAVSAGLSVLQCCVMSLLVFTGASQFAVVGVVAAGGSAAAGLGSALLLAARNGAYGLTMSRVLSGSLARRAIGAQLVIDESTAMAVAQPDGSSQERLFWWTGGAVFVFWNLGTLLGAAGGSRIGDPAALGLDAAFPAGFVVLLLPHLRKPGAPRVAVCGASLALVLVPLASPGVPVLAAALAVAVGTRLRPR
ncbi:MAG: AzlC family ABC transporter permease [Acidimicrobiia bacterium]